MSKVTVSGLLRKIEPEARSKDQFRITKEGLFRGVLKGAFVKAYEFARYSHTIKLNAADESCFFAASALRGICEDLIALKFLRRLGKNDRDEVTKIEMLVGVTKASAKRLETLVDIICCSVRRTASIYSACSLSRFAET
jgi:hypothetical protein